MKQASLHLADPETAPPGGQGWTILTGCGPTPFGRACLARTPLGISHLAFAADQDEEAAVWARLQRDWPEARLQRDDRAAAQELGKIFSWPAGGAYALCVQGTVFQRRVWQALTEIPPGRTISYAALAAGLGMPRAARAVGAAVGRNPVAWLIPCHRVVWTGGGLGGYHWGVARKRAMLDWEARHDAARPESPRITSG